MSDHIGKATTMIDLDALEKLADGVIGGWSKSRVLYEPEAATIKALITELKEARTMAHTINRVLSPQADRTFDLLISQSQWAVDTCRAFLARNGEEK